MKKTTLKDRQNFYHQWHQALHAGLPSSKALVLMTKSDNKIAEHIWLQLEKGATLQYSLKRLDFPIIEQEILVLGEQTGALSTSLKQLAYRTGKQRQQQKQLAQALLYPSILLATLLLTIGILCFWFIPQFIDFFNQSHAPLPKITQTLLGFCHTIQYQTPMMVPIFLIIHQLQLPLIRQAKDSVLLQIPLFNEFQTCQIVSKLGLVLQSGLSVAQGLPLLIKTCQNAYYRQKLIQLLEALQQGQPFHAACKNLNLFSPLTLAHFEHSLTIGNLNHSISHIAEQLDHELEARIRHWLTLIEPISLLLLSALVGFTLISLYVPIFELGNHIT